MNGKKSEEQQTADALAPLAKSIFLPLANAFPGRSLFRISFAEAVSGRFIQTDFHSLGPLSKTK